jgi:hypothetical protein
MAFLMGIPAAGPILWKLVIQHPKKFKGAKFPANWLQRRLSAVWPGVGCGFGGCYNTISARGGLRAVNIYHNLS